MISGAAHELQGIWSFHVRLCSFEEFGWDGALDFRRWDWRLGNRACVTLHVGLCFVIKIRLVEHEVQHGLLYLTGVGG